MSYASKGLVKPAPGIIKFIILVDKLIFELKKQDSKQILIQNLI